VVASSSGKLPAMPRMPSVPNSVRFPAFIFVEIDKMQSTVGAS